MAKEDNDLAKVGVEGSNPFARSKMFKDFRALQCEVAKAVPLVFALVNTWSTPLWPTLCRCAEFRIPACGDRILVLGSDTDAYGQDSGAIVI
jgi:hypothetical protein